MTTSTNSIKKPTFVGSFDSSLLFEMKDMETRYNGTYLWVKGKENAWALYHLNHVSGEAISLDNPVNGTIVIGSTTSTELEVRWPEVGLFDYKDTFCILNRIPDRQYKRAPCTRNTIIFEPIRKIFGVYERISFSFETVQAAFEPRLPVRIDDVVNSILREDIYGRCLNSSFAVSLGPVGDTEFLLWYQDSPIGIVIPHKRIIALKYKYVQQEVSDFIRDSEGNSWTIK